MQFLSFSTYFQICFSSVESLNRVRLFATPWIAARQASLSITNSWSSLRLASIESVIPSSHLILGHPLLLLPPIPPSIRVFSNESTLCMSQNIFHTLLWEVGCSLVVQMVKSLPAMRETQVQTLGQKDPLEKKMATHSSIPAWKIPWMQEPGRLQSMGSQRVGHDWVISLHFSESLYYTFVIQLDSLATVCIPFWDPWPPWTFVCVY